MCFHQAFAIELFHSGPVHFGPLAILFCSVRVRPGEAKLQSEEHKLKEELTTRVCLQTRRGAFRNQEKEIS